MKKNHEPIPTLEQVKEVIRRVDLSRLNNRLVGKPLIELEHCLIECLGYLTGRHRDCKEVTASMARDCMEAGNKADFLDCYRDYKKEKSEVMARYSMAAPTGRYFQALADRLNDRDDKLGSAGKLDGQGNTAVSHAWMLARQIVLQLDRMYQTGAFHNEKVETLWGYWLESSSFAQHKNGRG